MDNLKTWSCIVVLLLLCHKVSSSFYLYNWHTSSMELTTQYPTATTPTTTISPTPTTTTRTPTSLPTTQTLFTTSAPTPGPVPNVPTTPAKTVYPSALLIKILQNLGHDADAINQMAVNIKEESDIAFDVAALI